VFMRLDCKADEDYKVGVLMRSPVIAALAIGSYLTCQIVCLGAGGSEPADSLHKSGVAGSTAADSCCGTKQAPANPPVRSSCCDYCCCSGAVLTQPLPLEHLTVIAVLPLPWYFGLSGIEPKHTVVDPIPVSSPPEPPLGTIILLI